MNNKFTATLPREIPESLPPDLWRFTDPDEARVPDPDLISYYVLEKDRKLYIQGEIDEDSALSVQRMILRWNMEDRDRPPEERKPIKLFIFSPGGDIDCMWSLVDTVEASETPVWTVNVGKASSAAGLIFLAGHKRLMMKRSSLLIHEGHARMAGDAIKLMDASANYKNTIRQMKEYILQRTRISPAILGRQHAHDWVLDAAYCLEHGACEGIVEKLGEVL